MLNVYQGYSSSMDTVTAANEIIHQIGQSDVNYVVFFAGNNYDFNVLSRVMKDRFPKAEVVGCTTAGEISKNCFTQNSLVAMGIASKDFITATTVIENISAAPILHREELIHTFKKTGMRLEDATSGKHVFCFTLMDGLSSSEEKVLSVINSIFKQPGFPIIGGSAGDGLDFKETKVSYNGKVYTNAAVVTFVKTSHKFYIYKENIFKPFGAQMVVTKADIKNRIVYEFDHQPAAKYYAQKLGIAEKDLSKYFSTNPLGRKIGDKIWIASPFKVNTDHSIQFYCQVLTNSVLEILEPLDPVTVIHESIDHVKRNIKSIKGMIAVNCILRTLQFQQQNNGKQIVSPLLSLAPVVGFSSYGEQLNNTHLNQTLVLLALGE
ncbi:MAG: FIST signal transduction protein [Bacillota bacterium]